MPYDPTIYRGTAAHYVRGRPPYSAELEAFLRPSSVSTGRVGSSTLAVDREFFLRLAALFAEVVGLDPDADMLAEGARRAAVSCDVPNTGWVQAVAEDLPDSGARVVPSCDVRPVVPLDAARGSSGARLRPARAGRGDRAHGAHRRRPPGARGPGYPPIPHDAHPRAHRALPRLAPSSRRGLHVTTARPLRGHARAHPLRQRRGSCSRPGAPDLVQDVDGVLSDYHSMSFSPRTSSATARRVRRRGARRTRLRTPQTGEFWDWPGDTEILIARKPPTG